MKLSWLLIGAIVIFSLLSNFNSLIYNEPFAQDMFAKYGVYENVADANELHKSVISFYEGKGELSDVFNEREKKHIKDVKKVFRSMRLLQSLLILVLVLLLL